MQDFAGEDRARRRGRVPAKQARMKDVARVAGVAMITVSRALRSPDQVSRETHRRIEQAMVELGYVPNLVAGGLASTRTRIVAAIVPYVRHGVFADSIQGLSDALEAQGYCVLLGNSGGSPEGEEAIVRNLLGHRPAGFVLHGANHTDRTRIMLRKAQIPVVETGTLPADPVDLAVGYSNFDAAHGVTRLLVESGRRRIGFVSVDPATNDRAAERLRGYETALGAHGIRLDPALQLRKRFGMREGREALRELLARAPDLDAVFFTSDIWAAGAALDCTRRGIAVPQRLAVIGFNDQEVAGETIPRLTTVRVKRYEIGAIAAKLILDRLAGQPVAQAVVDVGFEIVRRASA